ncbi:hypothetical protein BD414DRAFT_501792 [Trametes punicea]|nr:hypothetical protein BD414DRAFT_501792 [Trametes punicea]
MRRVARSDHSPARPSSILNSITTITSSSTDPTIRTAGRLNRHNAKQSIARPSSVKARRNLPPQPRTMEEPRPLHSPPPLIGIQTLWSESRRYDKEVVGEHRGGGRGQCCGRLIENRFGGSTPCYVRRMSVITVNDHVQYGMRYERDVGNDGGDGEDEDDGGELGAGCEASGRCRPKYGGQTYILATGGYRAGRDRRK